MSTLLLPSASSSNSPAPCSFQDACAALCKGKGWCRHTQCSKPTQHLTRCFKIGLLWRDGHSGCLQSSAPGGVAEPSPVLPARPISWGLHHACVFSSSFSLGRWLPAAPCSAAKEEGSALAAGSQGSVCLGSRAVSTHTRASLWILIPATCSTSPSGKLSVRFASPGERGLKTIHVPVLSTGEGKFPECWLLPRGLSHLGDRAPGLLWAELLFDKLQLL